MGTLLNDLRYGLRMLAKNPGFAAVAVITLGLGIGANTAIFSVVDAVLLKPLPYADPDRLVMVWSTSASVGGPGFGTAPPDFREWQRQNSIFERMGAYWLNDINLSVPGQAPERLQGALISSNIFPLLGVKPVLGRGVLVSEEEFGRNRVALLSYGIWQRKLGGDPAIIGRTLILGGNSFTVVGVMPKGMPFFNNVPAVDLYVPLSFPPGDEMNTRSNHFLPVVARLKPGVSVAQGQAEMTTIARRLAQQYPENVGLGAKVVLLREQIVGDFRPALLVLFGAVAFVLLVACANVANLMLARAAAREKEFAVRIALGAGRGRLTRQLLAESLPLALAGGAVGVLLAQWGIESLVSLIPSNLPRFNTIAIDGRVLAFTAGASLLTALIFGLTPALQAAKADVYEALKEGGRVASEVAGRTHLRGLLVVSELALALMLLAGAGLMLRSFARLEQVDPGFSPRNVLTVQLPLSDKKYPKSAQARAFLEQLEDRVKALPGVEAAGVSTELPLGFGNGWGKYFNVIGHPEPTSLDKVPNVMFELDSPDYFSTIGVRLLAGRFFTLQDSEHSPQVAIINEALKKRFFPNEDAVGKTIRMLPPLSLLLRLMQPSERDLSRLAPERVILGVIGDVKNTNMNQPTEPTVYVPYFQAENEGWFNTMYLAVRAKSRPLELAAAVRAQVQAIDPDQPIAEVATLNDLIGRSESQSRFTTLLLALFAAVGLVLAVVGVYGVMAYSVAQRTHEIGVRMALGAGRRDVLRMVVGRGLGLGLAGVVTGLAGALALTRFLSSQLYGVRPTDPATFAGVSLILMVVAMLASYIPALRATKVDPMVALRYE